MPVWLTEDEFETLAVACDRLLPPSDASPGAVAAGVPDYIDGLLGAFCVDPPRIWAGGPVSGRHGGAPSFARFHRLGAARRAGLAHAHRRIPGPARAGVQRPGDRAAGALPPGAGRPGRRLPPRSARRPRTSDCDRSPTSPSCSSGTPARACTAPPSTAATATGPAGRPSGSPGTCSPAGGPTPRCRTRDPRRGDRGVRTGRGDRGRRAHRGRLVGGHHREGPQPPARPRGPASAGLRLLQRRDQVPHPALPRPRPVRSSPAPSAPTPPTATTPMWASSTRCRRRWGRRHPCRRQGAPVHAR